MKGISRDKHWSYRPLQLQLALQGTKFLNAERWSLFQAAAGWTSSQGIPWCLLGFCGLTYLVGHLAAAIYTLRWESALTGLADTAQKSPKVWYLQPSSCKQWPWWQSVAAAAPESLWFKSKRATGLLLSLRRDVGWKLLHKLFPCLPHSPVTRFPSGILERAVRTYILKTGM